MSALTSSPFLPLQTVAAAVPRKSGRAVCSDRGDAVWEWQIATGVFERDVTDEQLRQLEAPDLQIVEFTPTDTGQQAVWARGSHPAMPKRSVAMPRTRSNPLRELWAKIRGVQ